MRPSSYLRPRPSQSPNQACMKPVYNQPAARVFLSDFLSPSLSLSLSLSVYPEDGASPFLPQTRSLLPLPLPNSLSPSDSDVRALGREALDVDPASNR